MRIRVFSWLKKIAWAVFLSALALALWVAWLAFVPKAVAPLASVPNPVGSFDEAVSKVEAMRALAPAEVRAECRATILDHGKKTEHVYVLMHGLTNCPAQFLQFAELLHATGANVLVPRLPYHGYVEELDYRQREMTAQSMLDTAGLAVDLAHGYGEKITIIGLSVNGTTAAWLAQRRGDVHTAMIIAPFFAPAGVPSGWVSPLTRLISRLPNRLIWWDPVAQANIQGPEHAFARFATHSIAAVMQVGRDVFHLAETNVPPKAGRIIFVTSAVDEAINMDLVEDLAKRWEKSAPGTVAHHIFPAEAAIPHDAIDPAQPGADIHRVYPSLLEWLNEKPAETGSPRGVR
jgi:alpha-beta hydrolase superfamily lysophospholipase